MKQKPDGGAAFPQIESDAEYNCDGKVWSHTYSSGGMTLRDYFAAAAIQGLIASCSAGGAEWFGNTRGAKMAYEYADSMIAEREK